jgi:ABC-2 type transport system permease protein
MFMGVFGSAQFMLNSVIEEKNARVMEVLLAAVSPFELMAGKILGLTTAGLTLVAVWGGGALVAANVRGLTHIMSPALMIYFAVYFLLGFVLISSILAAIGSVCNTTKEAQALMGPIRIILVLPMVVWFYIVQNPNSTLALVMSFIPPITPMIMILRVAARPDLPLIQIVGSLVLLAVSVPVVVWASAKIFRTGILMYGKPPSLRELLRWVRYR